MQSLTCSRDVKQLVNKKEQKATRLQSLGGFAAKCVTTCGRLGLMCLFLYLHLFFAARFAQVSILSFFTRLSHFLYSASFWFSSRHCPEYWDKKSSDRKTIKGTWKSWSFDFASLTYDEKWHYMYYRLESSEIYFYPPMIFANTCNC